MGSLKEELDKRDKIKVKNEDFCAFKTLIRLGKNIKRMDRSLPRPDTTFKQMMRIKDIKPIVVESTDENAKFNLGYVVYATDPKETRVYKKIGYASKKSGYPIEDMMSVPQRDLIGVTANPLYQNTNGIFIGGTGSAKTVRAKREVENRYLRGRRIIVVDPKGEWEHGLPYPQETSREIQMLKWNGEEPRGFPVRIIPPRFDDRIVLHDSDILSAVASLQTTNQKAQVAILLGVFKSQVVPTLDHEPRIGDFVEFCTTWQQKQMDGEGFGDEEEEEEYDEKGKKKKKKKKKGVSLPQIQRGLEKLKERYDRGMFAPVLEEMLTMPQREIGVVSAGTVFRGDLYGVLIEHWTGLFFRYLMQNTCPKCYETYTSRDLNVGTKICTECGGHHSSGICQKCKCREFKVREPSDECVHCADGTKVVRVIPTDIVLEEVQEGTSKSDTLVKELARIMSINRVMGGGCGVIMITQSATVLKSSGGGQNPIYTNLGTVSYAGAMSGRQDIAPLREGFGIAYGTENTDDDKVQIIRCSDTSLGTKICNIMPPRSYHPMFSGFNPNRLNV